MIRAVLFGLDSAPKCNRPILPKLLEMATPKLCQATN
jgi:hypothetical protein